MIYEGRLTERQQGRSSAWSLEQPGKGGVSLIDGGQAQLKLGDTWIACRFFRPRGSAAWITIGTGDHEQTIPARDGMTMRIAIGAVRLPVLVVVELSPSIVDELRDVRHVSTGAQTVAQILATCADHVSQGLTRPGAWEAQIVSSLGFERGDTWGRDPESPWRCAPGIFTPDPDAIYADPPGLCDGPDGDAPRGPFTDDGSPDIGDDGGEA